MSPDDFSTGKGKRMRNTNSRVVRAAAAAVVILLLALLITGCNKTDKAQNVTSTKSKTFKQFVFPTENLKRYKFPTHINDIIIDRALSSYSEAFMVIIEPQKAPPFHKHDDTEQVFYVIDGTGVLTIGDNKDQYQVKPGDVVRIPVSTFHSIEADREKTLRYLCVDCFGDRPTAEPTWDAHARVLCETNGWDYSKVVSEPK
jgi:mannose-6-phosphate isomerase-like protein (cupin superfamily)